MKENQIMVVYTANCRGNQKNCLYPNKIELTNEEMAIKAFSRDTVFAEYRDNYRANDNFIRSNVMPFDCDNDHSDNPEEWITDEDIATFFEGVNYIIHYSRNHMKQKGTRSARPRFHILFLIDEITNASEYADIKRRVHNIFPYFDDKALDAARFFFGTENPIVSFSNGDKSLNEFISANEFESFVAESELIHEGGAQQNYAPNCREAIKEIW